MQSQTETQPFIFNFNSPTASGSSNLTLTASAPVAPPREHFSFSEPSTPTSMTYEEDGRVFGHLALWGSCHRGFANGAFGECVQPPKSRTDYSQFHLGQIRTAEGDTVAVGKITFDTGHAPLTADVAAASHHYDNTGSVGAYVRASNGRLGIWLSGSLRSDLPQPGLVALRANPLSGDWRAYNRNLELVASLAVPVPGFAVPQLALAASGEVQSLILTEQDWALVAGMYSPSQMRKKKALMNRAQMTAAVLTSKSRNALSKSDFAIPETRSYPIHNASHARNALARSSGKPEEGRVRAAVCKRYPAMCK